MNNLKDDNGGEGREAGNPTGVSFKMFIFPFEIFPPGKCLTSTTPQYAVQIQKHSFFIRILLLLSQLLLF